jgi:hypothetical protein
MRSTLLLAFELRELLHNQGHKRVGSGRSPCPPVVPDHIAGRSVSADQKPSVERNENDEDTGRGRPFEQRRCAPG